jgi:hypothetical protein
MLCLSNATFMEETVGERMTRVIVACVSILASAGVCASLVVSGEIHTGSIFSLMTQQFVPGGKKYNDDSLSLGCPKNIRGKGTTHENFVYTLDLLPKP